MSLPAMEAPPGPTWARASHRASLTSTGSLLLTEMPKGLTWMVGSSGASTREGNEGPGTSPAHDPHRPLGADEHSL